jgi:hypothetical protein
MVSFHHSCPQVKHHLTVTQEYIDFENCFLLPNNNFVNKISLIFLSQTINSN